jgi:hypothetical protein
VCSRLGFKTEGCITAQCCICRWSAYVALAALVQGLSCRAAPHYSSSLLTLLERKLYARIWAVKSDLAYVLYNTPTFCALSPIQPFLNAAGSNRPRCIISRGAVRAHPGSNATYLIEHLCCTTVSLCASPFTYPTLPQCCRKPSAQMYHQQRSCMHASRQQCNLPD